MDIDAIKAFLKMHSVIPNKFIDDFLDMNPRTALQTDPVIDLDMDDGSMLKSLTL